MLGGGGGGEGEEGEREGRGRERERKGGRRRERWGERGAKSIVRQVDTVLTYISSSHQALQSRQSLMCQPCV